MPGWGRGWGAPVGEGRSLGAPATAGWESREVKLGGTNGTQAVVLAGLREGEEVVLGNGTGQ